MSLWTAAQAQFVRDKSHSWDLFYSQRFWGTGLWDLVSPLLDSFNPDYGVPKQCGVPSESLPETTATILLALTRMNLLRRDIVELIQQYLWSTHYIAGSALDQPDSYPEAECWSIQTRNVWTTALCLWALIATGYRGQHEARYRPAVSWLLTEQNSDGSWGFNRDSGNPPSIFLTAVSAYTLRLALEELVRAEPSAAVSDVLQGLQSAVRFLRQSQGRRSGMWALTSGDPEPTGTTMAMWALRWCGDASDGDAVKRGVRGLRKCVGTAQCAATLEIAAGTLPDSREAIALQGYTPALPLALMQLDVSPLDPLVVQPLNFLRASRSPLGWDFPIIGSKQTGRYIKSVPYVGTGEPLTFTSALALQTAHAWHRRLLRSSIDQTLSP